MSERASAPRQHVLMLWGWWLMPDGHRLSHLRCVVCWGWWSPYWPPSTPCYGPGWAMHRPGAEGCGCAECGADQLENGSINLWLETHRGA